MWPPARSSVPFTWLRHRGLTLIELTISLLLGSIFTLAIVEVYLHSKRQFAAEEALTRLQENGRFALHLLKRELTHAGFYAGSHGITELAATAISSDCVSPGNWFNCRDTGLRCNDFGRGCRKCRRRR